MCNRDCIQCSHNFVYFDWRLSPSLLGYVCVCVEQCLINKMNAMSLLCSSVAETLECKQFHQHQFIFCLFGVLFLLIRVRLDTRSMF